MENEKTIVVNITTKEGIAFFNKLKAFKEERKKALEEYAKKYYWNETTDQCQSLK